MAIHNEAKLGEIAKTVIMPGDPMRAKYIAEKYLTNYRLVNQVRGMLAYTGEYKGKTITVMAHGMGMPSMGIYCYELYKFYEVENIIRIGSCGGFVPTLNLSDTILVENSYNEGNFAYNMDAKPCHFIEANLELTNLIKEVAKEKNQKLVCGNIASTECFDPYLDDPRSFANRCPERYNIIGSEMESFALFYTAKKLGKKAACLLTVADVPGKVENLTAEERQNSMTNMIELALDCSLKLE